MLLLSALLAAFLPLVEAKVADPCNGLESGSLPADGSVGVSPDAIPALLVGDCGGGDFTVTLTPDAGEPVVQELETSTTGIWWLSELTLAADTHYTLAIAEAWSGDATTSNFSTGSAPPEGVTGAPDLSITGWEVGGRHRGGALYTVALDPGLVSDPAGAPWQLRRDGEVTQVGVDGTTMVESFWGGRVEDHCWSVTQYRADSTVVGESDDACDTMRLHGCATTGAGSTSVGLIAAAIATLLGRAPRRGSTRAR